MRTRSDVGKALIALPIAWIRFTCARHQAALQDVTWQDTFAPGALVGKDRGMARSPATHGLHDGIGRRGTMGRCAGGAADNIAKKQIRND